MPSANTLDEPGICEDSKHHPVFTSNTPSHLIMNAARGSRVPPHRLTQETADELSPRMRAGSPATEGRSSFTTTITYAVTTIASSSKRLIDSLLWEAQVVRADERCCSLTDKSYRHQTRDSLQNPQSRLGSHLTTNVSRGATRCARKRKRIKTPLLRYDAGTVPISTIPGPHETRRSTRRCNLSSLWFR